MKTDDCGALDLDPCACLEVHMGALLAGCTMTRTVFVCFTGAIVVAGSCTLGSSVGGGN